jgi:hypothetical protein
LVEVRIAPRHSVRRYPLPKTVKRALTPGLGFPQTRQPGQLFGGNHMAWIDIPHNHITFGLFVGSAAGATVTVAPADVKLFRYKAVANDTVVVDFRIAKAFFHPSNAAVTGITMELSVPFGSVHFPALGTPNSFMDAGQSYTNDCVIAIDPGSLAHVAGCVAVLNEPSHKVILLIRNIPDSNLNANGVGVVGAFGQITFEVTHREKD